MSTRPSSIWRRWRISRSTCLFAVATSRFSSPSLVSDLREGTHLFDERSARGRPADSMIHDDSTDRTALARGDGVGATWGRSARRLGVRPRGIRAHAPGDAWCLSFF